MKKFSTVIFAVMLLTGMSIAMPQAEATVCVTLSDQACWMQRALKSNPVHQKRHVRHHKTAKTKHVRRHRTARHVTHKKKAAPTRKARLFSGSSGGSTRALHVAKRYVGRNPTRHRSLWCADFVNLVERKAGRRGTGSRLAKSYLRYGHRVHSPRPGDIAVYSRGGNKGHVAYVYKVSGSKVAIIGGNQCGRHGHRTVCVSWRSKRAAIAYRRV